MWLRLLLICSAIDCGVFADDVAVQFVPLPTLPNTPGVATPFAGVISGQLIVAGGANFPDAPPWKGGKKVWRDEVYRLHGERWNVAGRLDRPVAYGVSFQTPRGILCVGGSDSDRHFADSFWLTVESDHIRQSPAPALPEPVANACGAIVGNTVIIAGGTSRPDSTAALNHVFAMDLSGEPLQWKLLTQIPGDGRMLSVAAGTDEHFYLFSGASLEPGPDGKPKRTYLKECLMLHVPSLNWTTLPDMPAATVAAPTPAAVVAGDRIVILGGDDGSAVGFQPPEEHPGFLKKALILNTKTSTWNGVDLPVSRVTVPLVHDGSRYLLPSGELKPGIRSPEVFEVRFSTK